MILDKWQEEVLAAEGNICLCSGRQVGKSEIIALKTARYIVKHPKKRVLVVSVTEDQAELMLQKILSHLFDIDKKLICKGNKKPTKHKVELINGSWAMTRAVGATGAGMRGMTVDVLVPDECAYLPSAVWQVLTPMILTTGGQMWLLSTPNAKEGYFYEAYTKPEFGFKTFHVNSEEVAEGRPEPLRSMMLEHLAREKIRMSPLEYAQQYLAQFLEEVGQLFSDDLIQKSMCLTRSDAIGKGEYYLGVDVARMGGDESTFEVVQKIDGKFYHRENIVNKYTLLTDTIKKILELDKRYHFKNVYIDSAGLGSGVYDYLLTSSPLNNRITSIENASRTISPDASRKRKLLKEDLYMNLLGMMERGEVKLLNDDVIFQSLKSIMLEHDPSNANIKIYGRYSHIAEGLIRAAWANHNTRLDLWAR